jgi:integrase/ribosomal protein L37E
MGNIYLHKEDRTVKTLLDRINGQVVMQRKDLAPMYAQAVPEPNRSALVAFYRSMVTDELSLGRICVVLGNLYRVSIWLNHRPFEELSRDDLAELVERIRHIRLKRLAKATLGDVYAEQTVESYKIAIKKFWRWLKNPDASPEELRSAEYPPEVSWIRRRKSKNGLLPKDIWTPEEVNKLASMAGSTRDKAFILGLFGSGCRIGEFLPLKRKDVLFDEYSAQLLVDGKTGSRRVRMTPAASVAMSGWLDVHPNRSPDAPVWINTQACQEAPKGHLTYDWAHEMLKRLGKRAKIDKPIRPHLFRHSLATHYAPKLTEAVMNEHFGWRQGGRTAAIYTHLSGKQVDDEILAVFGRKQDDVQVNKAIDSIACLRCGLKNTSSSLQCSKCGFPLSDEAAKQLYQRRQQADHIMNAVTKDPDFQEAFKKAVQKLTAERLI